MYGTFLHLGAGPLIAVLAATAFSGTVTAAFYGGMKVAMVGTMVGVMTTISYLIAADHPEHMAPVLLIALVAGAIAGLLFSSWVRIAARPLGPVLSGLLSGLVWGGVIALSWKLVAEPYKFVVAAAIAAGLVGVSFIYLVRWIGPRCAQWIPPPVSGAFVASMIAAVVAGSMWLVGSTTSGMADIATLHSVDRIMALVPDGLSGGLVGGAMAGVVLELFGVEWGVKEL